MTSPLGVDVDNRVFLDTGTFGTRTKTSAYQIIVSGLWKLKRAINGTAEGRSDESSSRVPGKP
jgi:hypothetical protein